MVIGNKTLFLFPLFLLLLFSCSRKEDTSVFTLQAELGGLTEDTILVQDAMSYRDSTLSIIHHEGRFTFESAPDTFSLYRFTVNGGRQSFYVFADKGGMVEVTGNVDSAVVIAGNVAANERLMAFETALGGKINDLRRLHGDDSDDLGRLTDSLTCAEAAAYVTGNSDDYVSAVVMEKYMWDSRHPDYVLMDSVLSLMSGFLFDLPEMHKIKATVDRKKASFPGRNVYLGNLEFTDGSELLVADLRKNYLFVEFWASWSDASLDYHERLKDVYAKFGKAQVRENGKMTGVKFIGVSLDTDKSRCDSVVDATGISWPQVCDGEGWITNLADKYAVTSLPDNVLVGLNNKVIARSLTVEQLDSILSAKFKR